MDTLGKRIRSIRELLELNQSEMAKELSLESPMAISKYELDQREPDIDKLIKIAALGAVSLDWLLLGVGPMKGWTYYPRNPKDAFDWINRQLSSNVKRIVIVSYHPASDKGGGMENGFILVTDKGVLSMNGSETRSGYRGGGPMFYAEILKLIREKAIPTGQVRLSEKESPSLDNTDLSTMVPAADFTKNIIEEELSALGYATPGEQERKAQPATPEEFVSVSAADGTAPIVAFNQHWIGKKGDPTNMRFVRITGDSMEPTLQPGDVVLVDQSKQLDPQGGIYAISVSGSLMIRRVQISYPSGELRIISDNPKYEASEVEADKVGIFGKVIWYSRELER